MRQLTVANEDDRLGIRVVLRLRNVRLEAADFILSAGGFAFTHLAAQAAVAHSYVLRHCDCRYSWSIETVEGRVCPVIKHHGCKVK